MTLATVSCHKVGLYNFFGFNNRHIYIFGSSSFVNKPLCTVCKQNMNFTRNWAKYKSSGTYRRAVKRNVERIHSDSVGDGTKTQVSTKKTLNAETNRPHDDHFTTNFALDSGPQIGDNFNTLNEDRVNRANEDEDTWDFHYNFEEKEFDDIEMDTNVRHEMKKWAITNNISHVALKEVLQIWNNRIPNILPSDPRTLLNTPATIEIYNMGSGKYWHCGLISCLKIVFQDISEPAFISLNVNIDGLPLFKSTKDEFWPILFNIFEMPHVKPMVIGIYHGKGKPDNMPAFLELFVNELKDVINDGVTLNGHKISVSIRSFICDSPARAFIKGKFSLHILNFFYLRTGTNFVMFIILCNLRCGKF